MRIETEATAACRLCGGHLTRLGELPPGLYIAWTCEACGAEQAIPTPGYACTAGEIDESGGVRDATDHPEWSELVARLDRLDRQAETLRETMGAECPEALVEELDRLERELRLVREEAERLVAR